MNSMETKERLPEEQLILVNVLVPCRHKAPDQQPVFKVVQIEVFPFSFHSLSTSLFDFPFSVVETIG